MMRGCLSPREKTCKTEQLTVGLEEKKTRALRGEKSNNKALTNTPNNILALWTGIRERQTKTVALLLGSF